MSDAMFAVIWELRPKNKQKFINCKTKLQTTKQKLKRLKDQGETEKQERQKRSA